MEKEIIVSAARDLVKEGGLINLSKAGLCTRAGIPEGSFQHIMGQTFTEFIETFRGENPECVVTESKVTKSRVNPQLRKDHILNTAIEIAKADTYKHVTVRGVAKQAGVSCGLVSRYFSIEELRLAILKKAIDCKIIEIVTQGVIFKSKVTKNISDELRHMVNDYISGE